MVACSARKILGKKVKIKPTDDSLKSSARISGLKVKTYPQQTQISKNGTRSQVMKLNDGPAIKVEVAPESTYYEIEGEIFIKKYARLLIRQKK